MRKSRTCRRILSDLPICPSIRGMLRFLFSFLWLAVATVAPASAADTVNVLYAGSLVNLMERSLGPAFANASGEQFRGYAGGSSKLANEIKGGLRRGDIFISASPKIDQNLMGTANGDWVRWYILFAESPLVIGYNSSSRFADSFKNKPWYQALLQPGIKLGRTDPKLDPKGAFTVELVQQAEEFYHQPGLAQLILGAPDNPAQVLPEEVLVGRFQSGELDVAFFYSTEAADNKIRNIKPPADIDPKARYTISVLNKAPNTAGAERFVLFLLGNEGQGLLQKHGLDSVRPTVSGDAEAIPAAIKSLIAKIQ
jgi:molybdate transport system substrate-binding protein